MKAICLVDTSIFVEIINVPLRAKRHEEIIDGLTEKLKDKETLFLPMATILETGNHISRYGDGSARRKCAERFVAQVRKAVAGESPFTPINFLEANDLHKWLTDFPDEAMQGMGLGDLSIKFDWERLCEQNHGRRVYIWSLDSHLRWCDNAPP
jgi:predicted nucleic acid-binding protein